MKHTSCNSCLQNSIPVYISVVTDNGFTVKLHSCVSCGYTPTESEVESFLKNVFSKKN